MAGLLKDPYLTYSRTYFSKVARYCFQVRRKQFTADHRIFLRIVRR